MSDNGLMLVNELLQQFGNKVGVADANLNAHAAKSFLIDNQTYTLQYSEINEELYLICKLGSLPENPAERMALQAFLLNRNCFFNGTGPGVLGTRSGDNAIFYTARLACAELSYQDFEQVFQAIVTTCQKLSAEMHSNGESAAFPKAEEPLMGMDFALRV